MDTQRFNSRKTRIASSPQIVNPWKRQLATWIDRIIGLIYRPLSWFVSKDQHTGDSTLDATSRILVIQLDHIGDTVMSTPLYAAIKQRYPQVRITALIGPWSTDILKYNPFVDECIVHAVPWFSSARGSKPIQIVLRYLLYAPAYWKLLKELRAQQYRVGLELRGDLRHILLFAYLGGCKRRIGYDRTGGAYLLTDLPRFDPTVSVIDRNLRLLEPLQIHTACRDTAVWISKQDEAKAQEVVGACTNGLGKAIVIVHPGSRTPIKRWPASRFAEFLRWLHTNYEVVSFLVGTRDEREMCEEIAILSEQRDINVVAGDLSLLEVTALLKKADLFVGNHSSIQHLAAASSIPMVIIFGPDDPSIFGPAMGRFRILVERPPCWPCMHLVCPISQKPWGSCIDSISVSVVSHAIYESGYLTDWEKRRGDDHV